MNRRNPDEALDAIEATEFDEFLREVCPEGFTAEAIKRNTKRKENNHVRKV